MNSGLEIVEEYFDCVMSINDRKMVQKDFYHGLLWVYGKSIEITMSNYKNGILKNIEHQINEINSRKWWCLEHYNDLKNREIL